MDILRRRSLRVCRGHTVIGEDWLSLPGDEASELQLAMIDRDAIETPPVVSNRALAKVTEQELARARFAIAWRNLTLRQTLYLRTLQASGFNSARAMRQMKNDKHPMGKALLYRWRRSSKDFEFVLTAMQTNATEQVVSRTTLLLRANDIAETALEGEPVFGVDRENGGDKIIGYEKKLDTALRANEQLMKATKVLGGDERVSVSVGPALVVQIVQRDGSVLDATPRGVTIDLPVPPK